MIFFLWPQDASPHLSHEHVRLSLMLLRLLRPLTQPLSSLSNLNACLAAWTSKHTFQNIVGMLTCTMIHESQSCSQKGRTEPGAPPSSRAVRPTVCREAALVSKSGKALETRAGPLRDTPQAQGLPCWTPPTLTAFPQYVPLIIN